MWWNIAVSRQVTRINDKGDTMFAHIHARFRSPAPIGQPSALPAISWQAVLGVTLIMLVATLVAQQARPLLWPSQMAETRLSLQSFGNQKAAEEALRLSVERLDRFNRETRLYLDPDAEVTIPGFGYGSPNAMRLQLQDQVEALRADHQRLRQTVEIARAHVP